MLTMTDNATDVVKQIMEQSVAAEAADDAGLRISQETEGDAPFALAPVETPEPGDQVLEANGARVFLDEGAATVLADKVLDAQVDNDGSVQFGIGEQG